MSVTRQELEAVLASQSEACGTGDLDQVRPFCSSRMLSGLQNIAATMQMEIEEFLKASTGDDAMLLEAMGEFENVETPVSGDTAGWFGARVHDLSEDMGGPTIEYILVRYAREEDAWKMDGVHMHEMPKGDIVAVTYAALEETIDPEMRIDGVVHAAEEPVGEVEIAGAIQMDATGFRIGILVNGTETVTAEGNSSVQRVTSLKSGENVLLITAEPLEESPFAPEVKVAIYSADSEYPTEAFSWRGDVGKFSSTEQTFEI